MDFWNVVFSWFWVLGVVFAVRVDFAVVCLVALRLVYSGFYFGFWTYYWCLCFTFGGDFMSFMFSLLLDFVRYVLPI